VQSWNPHFSKDEEILEKVQKMAIKCVKGMKGKKYLFYLFIYLFGQAHTLRIIRQGLEQDSKAQTCTDCYPKIT